METEMAVTCLLNGTQLHMQMFLMQSHEIALAKTS